LFLTVASAAAAQSTGSPGMRLVATVPQMGPVGYRDPLGVVSPSGDWLAFTSGDAINVVKTAGGPIRSLARFNGVSSIAWHGGDDTIAALTNDGTRWRWVFIDARDGKTRDAWTGTFATATPGFGEQTDPHRFGAAAWSRDGARLAGITYSPKASSVWIGNADGTQGRTVSTGGFFSFPTWTPDGATLACLEMSGGHQRVSLPCAGGAASPVSMEAYGPIAFSPDGRTLYFGSPNARGTLELYAQPLSGGGSPRRLASFPRDTYMPSVTRRGNVLFGAQDYRTSIAVAPATGGGGPVRQVTAFQSETPSWSRDDRTIAFTFGSWRTVLDDMRYPNIAQDLGVVRADGGAPAAKPARVVRASPSEDQGLDWSPDGRWIALHSHENGLDDVWLQPADGSAPARPITKGGYETGWPRWSPDGKWVAYSTEVFDANGLVHGVAFVVGVNQMGVVTEQARRIPIDGVDGDIDAVEWLTADSLVLLAGLANRKAIYVASRDGGPARTVHRFTSEQHFSGVGVSTKGRWVAFVAPGPDGHFQVFRVPLAGGTPQQVTTDPTDKTQPSVSHDGVSIAFTVFSYQMKFWLMESP
jgi:Tol biopolymer transport system component